MTLENLLKIGKLHEHAPTPGEIERLLAAARRSLSDARVEAISNETRFDAAYKTILQAALAAMLASGYRPVTTGGHHAVVLQALGKTAGIEPDRLVILDALRRQRNQVDYRGAPITTSLVDECIGVADLLLRDINLWIQRHAAEHIQG